MAKKKKTYLEQYVDELRNRKQMAVDRFGNLTTLENDILNSSFDWLVENLEIKNNTFQVSDDLTALMNKFVNVTLEIINQNESYQNKLSDYLRDLKTLSKNIITFQSDFNKIDVAREIKPVQATMTQELIDRLTDNGLNANFVQPLRDVIYNNAVAGMNLRQARQYLTDFVTSGKDKSGRLKSYIEQTATIGVDAFEGAINTKIQAQFATTGLIISGSLIDK